MVKKISFASLFAAFVFLSLASPASAQSVSRPTARVVTTCGTPPYTYSVGQIEPLLQDTTGTQCTYGSGGGGGGGDASAANQVTGNTSLGTIATNTTGVSTAANQSTGNTTLSSILTAIGDFLGTKAPGTAATKSALTGGVYNSAGVTLADGQQAATQMNASGATKVELSNNGSLQGDTLTGLRYSTIAGASSAGATRLITCTDTAVYDASTNGSTELVALTSSAVIYVCGYTILAAGTVNVELDYGTGSACATGNTKVTPAFQLTAQTGAVDGSSFYRGMKGAASNALCLKTNGAVAVQALVYYTKFVP